MIFKKNHAPIWILIGFQILILSTTNLLGQSTPTSGSLAFTHIATDGNDIVELITLERLDLSQLGITDNGICSDDYFRDNEGEMEGFSSLTDVPAGTYIRFERGVSTLEDLESGVLLYNYTVGNLSLANGGDQLIVFLGSLQGSSSCGGGSGSNTFIAGINVAGTNAFDWVSGATSSNDSKAPGTLTDYDTGGNDNYRINPTTSISGTASEIRVALLDDNNWEGDDEDFTSHVMKDIQFTEPNLTSGSLVLSDPAGDDNILVDASGLNFSNTDANTRYLVVVNQGAPPSDPTDFHTCYANVSGDFETAPTVISAVTTPPCTGTTEGDGRVVYFGYGLPSSLTVSGLSPEDSDVIHVSVYAVNGNGASANVSSTEAANSQSASLPVSLNSFTAESKGDYIQLAWETQSELNNNYIALEKSDNGIDFLEINRFPGTGNRNQVKKYQDRDYQPIAGLNYYRLRQVDYDGSSNYHPIIVVKYSHNKSEISIYPSVVKNELNIIGLTTEIGEIQFQIVNINGRVVHQQTIRDLSNTSIALSHLIPGQYIVRMDSQAGFFVSRFIKSK